VAVTAAVFDLDGTLVLTEGRNRVVWQRFFDGYGIEVDEALTAQLTGRRGLDALREMPHLFPDRDPRELLAEVLAHEVTDDLPEVAPVPGANDLVRRLHAARVPLGLVTSALAEHVAIRLQAVDLVGVFDVVVTGRDVTVGKPDPQGFRMACEQLGVPARNSVGFEDSPAGVAAVKAAGMFCVAVTTTFSREVLAEADLVVADLTDVPWPIDEVA
jgi:sugar-phosphatase